MKGFKLFPGLATDEECQSIIDSCKRAPDDRLQNRWEIKEFEIPETLIEKAQECLGNEKIIAERVQCYFEGDSFSAHRDAIWLSMPKHGVAKEIWKRDRNLSMSIVLNDEYQGGDLIIEGERVPAKKGDGVLFSAMALHWVEGIWEGCRMSVAVWSGTWDFKKITPQEMREFCDKQDNL